LIRLSIKSKKVNKICLFVLIFGDLVLIFRENAKSKVRASDKIRCTQIASFCGEMLLFSVNMPISFINSQKILQYNPFTNFLNQRINSIKMKSIVLIFLNFVDICHENEIICNDMSYFKSHVNLLLSSL